MEKTYLWVDEITHNSMAAETNDEQKVYHNLAKMGDYGIDLERSINVKLLVVQKHVQSVGSAGRFICTTHFIKASNKTNMSLFDCMLFPKHKWRAIAKIQFPDIVDQFMESYQEALLSSLSSELDSFELSLSAI